jgi:hypothetical protein
MKNTGSKEKIEVFVDGNLMEQAEKGNREAIREVAQLAASHIKDLSIRGTKGEDVLTDFVVQALEEIAEYSTPNDAFRWSRRGAQPKNQTVLEWSLAQYIENIIPKLDGEIDAKTAKAIEIVGEAACLDGYKSGIVETYYYRWKDIDMPKGIFPFAPDTFQKLKHIESRLDNILKKYLQK